MLVDSHCHLDRLKLDKLEEPTLDCVVREAQEAGVNHMLCVGIDMGNAAAVKSIADTYDNVYASVGVHPMDVSERISAEQLIDCADHKKVVAIGETGLDYFYTKDTAEVQHESLVMHLEVARSLELPVIIHTRDAKEDTLAILDQHVCRRSVGVLHCFTEDLDMAMRAIDLGFYISFSGIVTFKNAAQLQEVAREIPLDRMLVETDSPYLTPVPFRGKPNFPKHTADVARFISEMRGISFDALAEQTTDNFFALFPKAGALT
ncbi:putative metal-dependent hydrolase YcfH [BD1-7 clade bacterium]|uniref:Putative metal-dependent hydrolase YcfH n=1 Tax=BD1-7 clade bacterium TaxID=2029982 RepID=A0A5S9QT15_9GAMM|nr:putative metal-dependent hydrolase YcfH [BD1-7 clade bacterium]CAA0122598.1 putative metal-dependent hydrolase YcfH [BD1-7 clade bacterium]